MSLGTIASAQPAITVDASTIYQTINGWECTAWAAQDSSPAFEQYRDELFTRTINEAGINRIRLEVRSGAENSRDYWSEYQTGQVDYATWRANRYATVNDNADSGDLDASGFHFSELDNTVQKVVLPLRQLVAANGESLYVNLNYVAFTAQITAGGAYHHNNPDEYAEFMLAVFQHMDARYGFVPDAIEILLEPDNVSQWNGNLIGRAIVATAARLREAGYDCEFIAPSCTNMGNAVSYFDALAAVPGALAELTELSYHRYGGVSDANLRAIAARAEQRGLRTSMLEWWSNGNGHATLHQDLKTGNNAAWQHGVIGGPGTVDDSMTLYVISDANPARPVVTLNRKARLARHYYRFVRRGAVRIGATSTDAGFDPLAFVHPTGEHVVVVKASKSGTFAVRGLPAGTYALRYSTPSQFDVRLPAQTLAAGDELLATMPRDGVLTAYSVTLRLLQPTIQDGQLNLTVSTLDAGTAIRIERTFALDDDASWSSVATLTLDGLRANWSDPLQPDGGPVFYRLAVGP